MKNRQILLLLAIIFLTFFSLLYAAKSGPDIQIYDTYYIFDQWMVAIFGTAFLVFVASLLTGIVSKFSNKTSNWSLLVSGLISISFITYFVMLVIRSQSN
jgi:hypothetical protein